MRFLVKKIFFIILLPTIMAGCQNEIDYNNNADEDIKVTLSGTNSRGYENNLDSIKVYGFGFFGYSSKNEWSNSTKSTFFHNEKAFYKSNAWGYSDIKIWPKDSLVSFFAYSPYFSDNTIIQKDVFTGAPTINFAVRTDTLTKMIDLLTDCRSANRNLSATSNNGYVNFSLSHVLTSMIMYGKNKSELPTDTKVFVTKIEMTASENILYKKGKYSFLTDGWTNQEEPYTSLNLTEIMDTKKNTYGTKFVDIQSVDITGINEAISLFKKNHAIYMLPVYHEINGILKDGLQNNGDVKLKISYSIAVKDEDPIEKTAEFSLNGYTSDTELGELAKGKQYKYSITFDVVSDLLSLNVISVENWEDSEPENIMLQ